MTVEVNVGAGAVLGVAGVAAAIAGAWWLKKNAGAIADAAIDAVNPASHNNLVNKGVTAVVGQENLSSAADRVFGAIDLINPWNDSDVYARQVYGLDKK